MSIDVKRRLAAAAFIALLALSVFWPGPAIEINQLCCHAHLTVDDLSFLGALAMQESTLRRRLANILEDSCYASIRQPFSVRDFHESRIASDVFNYWNVIAAKERRLRSTTLFEDKEGGRISGTYRRL